MYVYVSIKRMFNFNLRKLKGIGNAPNDTCFSILEFFARYAV